MYSKKAIKHFQKPAFAGEMKKPDAVGEEGNIRCGDVMKIYIKVKNDVIADIKFQTYGCVAAIAATDVLCKLAKGKKLDDAMKITFQDIIKELGELPPIKYHCAVMGVGTLKRAITDYKEKHKEEKHKKNTKDTAQGGNKHGKKRKKRDK